MCIARIGVAPAAVDHCADAHRKQSFGEERHGNRPYGERSEDLVDVAPETPLLWVIRDQLGLTGTKFSCGIAQCGACTLQSTVDPFAPAASRSPAAGKTVTTIEGLSADGTHPVQLAWIELDVPQCGYCQSGMIMSVVALLKQHPNPTDTEIDAEVTNACRCSTYHRVRKAIRLAASRMRWQGGSLMMTTISASRACLAASFCPPPRRDRRTRCRVLDTAARCGPNDKSGRCHMGHQIRGQRGQRLGRRRARRYRDGTHRPDRARSGGLDLQCHDGRRGTAMRLEQGPSAICVR